MRKIIRIICLLLAVLILSAPMNLALLVLAGDLHSDVTSGEPQSGLESFIIQAGGLFGGELMAAFAANPEYGGFIAPIEAPAVGSVPISNRAELDAIRYNLYGIYHLTADIDLSGAEWEPIGDSTNCFAGIFDGQGYVIRNLTITGDREYSGLFGFASGATIKNVGLEGTYIEIASNEPAYAGGICGYLGGYWASLSNCFNSGSVSVSSSSTMNNSGGVSAFAGGICAYSSSVGFEDCYNKGTVFASSGSSFDAIAGGICAYMNSEGSSVSRSFNSGLVIASSLKDAYAGGIAGSCLGLVNLSNCYNTGSVIVSASLAGYAGGVSANMFSGSISKCYNTGSITVLASSTALVGGICGNVTDSDLLPQCSISNSYWNSDSAQMVNGVALGNTEKKGSGEGIGNTAPLTSAEMRQAGYFAGFDFDTVWDFRSGANNGYPVFRLTEVYVTSFAQLQSEVAKHANASEDRTIVIGADFDITENLYIPAANNKALTIKGDSASRQLRRGVEGQHLIIVNSGASLFLEDIIIDGYADVYALYNSALVFVNSDSAFTMSDGAVLRNNNGGGVFVHVNGVFTIHGGLIADNFSYGGGGVNVYEGTLNMNGGVISGNTTGSSGGGVYVQDGVFTMDGGSISGNTAEYGGGGVSVGHGATFVMNGGEIVNNTCTLFGGGVHIAYSSFTLNDGEIRGNVGYHGGGLHISGSILDGINASYSDVILNGGVIAENTASTGGGVYVDHYGSVAMYNGIISGNIAYTSYNSGSGGGVCVAGNTITTEYVAYASGGVFRMSGGEIKNNTAQMNGGGVSVVGAVMDADRIGRGSFIMDGGSISGNTASNGGGVNINYYGSCNISDGAIFDNYADYGGGFSVSYNGIFTMSGGDVSNNSATIYGGGGYVVDSNITLGGSAKVTDNRNKYYDYPSNLYLGHYVYIILSTDSTAPDSSMDIHVQTSDANGVIVVSGAVSEHAACFTPDDTGKKVVCENGALKLVDAVVTFLGYNTADIVAINGIIANNGLDWAVADVVSGKYLPYWVGVTWSADYANKRIVELDIAGCNLTGTLSLSGLDRLKSLNCSNNQLTGLDLSELNALESLWCFENNLATLDVSGLGALKTLNCSDNQLTALNVSGLSRLQSLNCGTNQLSDLNLSGLNALESLWCFENNITVLNVSGLAMLKSLGCYDNQLTSLSVSGLSRLQFLNCGKNKLTGLNLSGLTSLKFLGCYSNLLTSLSLSDCYALEDLYCFANGLTTLNVMNNPRLQWLNCSHNQLSALNIFGLTRLQYVNCISNSMVSHDRVIGWQECGLVLEADFVFVYHEVEPQDAIVVAVKNVSTIRGATVTVPVEISNNPGIAALTLNVGYDPNVLTILEVEAPNAYLPLNTQHAITTTPGTQRISLLNSQNGEYSQDGVIINITFGVSADAEYGDTAISIAFTEFSMGEPDGYPVNSKHEAFSDAVVIGGKVTIRSVLLGDLNSDGVINNADILLMLQYFAQESADIDVAAADVNSDGDVDGADLLLFLKFFAQQGTVLGPQ